ncbi:MAG: DNA-binding protein [Motiliproteus sp.]|nr:DNA-binding protein [Motiliproteus sp.]MCW9051811.1 DNA-binding protein [Motiliproteus sp.]
MSITHKPEVIQDIADRLLRGGEQPTVQRICEQLGVEDDGSVDLMLSKWWTGLSQRIQIMPAGATEVPELLQQGIANLWQDALKEATDQLSHQHQTIDHSIQTLKQESEDLLVSSRQDYDSLETRFRRENMRAEEAENLIKVLQAEISVLKSNLAGEVNLRNQTEDQLQDARQDIKRGNKTLEDAKRTFDGRLKDEQAHNQELLSKAEAELRHYRTNLGVVRDEAGKKESALTKNIHDLQSEVAKRDVKVETLQGQVKSLEKELKSMRMDTGDQTRKLSQANSRLLSETNINKRLDERVKQLETDLKFEQQRFTQQSTDSMRKESEMRQSLKAQKEELVRVKTSLNSAQKKMIAQEEQIRRLHAQAKV